MKRTRVFELKGKNTELPIYQRGDRVRSTLWSTTEEMKGTVAYTRNGGLYVTVQWDKREYESVSGGWVRAGREMMVDTLELLED